MFCSIAKSAMRDSEKAVEQAHPLKRQQLGKEFLFNTEKLLQEFRACRPETGEPDNLELFDLVDEFLSINSNSYRYKLWEFFSIYDNQEMISLAAEVTGRELEYRKKREYPSMPYENADNSELLYRESTLKKAMAGILFLNVETRRAGVFLENLLLGVAAAVAMALVPTQSMVQGRSAAAARSINSWPIRPLWPSMTRTFFIPAPPEPDGSDPWGQRMRNRPVPWGSTR